MQARDNEVFEDIITRMYVGLVHPGDTCLDGGASLGLHTVRLARLVGPEGTVFALEPEPSSARSLEGFAARQCSRRRPPRSQGALS